MAKVKSGMLRIPYTINPNTHAAYEPHQEALALVGERYRKLRPEDWTWTHSLVPTLIEQCILSLLKRFRDKPYLDELLCADRHYLMELLPVDLPLSLVVPLIEEEVYWKRRYFHEFNAVLSRKRAKWTWKSLYLERYMRKVVEEAQPQYCDEDDMEDITKLLQPYIKRLIVKQLQEWQVPLTWEKEEEPDIYPNDHISFKPILAVLDNIVELDIRFGRTNVGDQFTWHMFQLSVGDCKRLGEACKGAKSLKILRIHQSRLEDGHAQALMQQLVKNKTIVDLDLSNCLIADEGALCIAKFMMTHRTVERIRLVNNRIGGKGGQAIGFAIHHEGSCPLTHLDLRLNPLGHEGCMGIFRALVRSPKPQELNIAGCYFDDLTSMRFASMISLNKSLIKVDVSNNWFTPEASETLLQSVLANFTLQYLDMRETDIPAEIVTKIQNALTRHRHGDPEKVEGDSAYDSTDQVTKDLESHEELILRIHNLVGDDQADQSATKYIEQGKDSIKDQHVDYKISFIA